MMIKIQRYRKNRFRLIVRWEGKRHFIYSLSEGKPLMDHGTAWVAKEYIENEIEAGTFNPLEWRGHRSFDFERATKIWLENSNCSIEWLANRKRIVERFLVPFFRNWDIRKIGTVDLYRFLNFVKSKGNYKDKTVKNILDELRVFLNFHKESIPKVPVFPKIKFQTPPIRWINETDQNRIFEFIPEEHKGIFTFMRYTGCRPGEAGGLLKSNIFLEGDNPYLILATCLGKNQRIKETTKTKIAKPLPVIPELVEILKPKDLSPLVFSHKTRAGLVPYRRQYLEGIWNEANRFANQKYGTPRINLYNGLKHSFGVQRLNQGFSIEQIKEVFGHVDTRTTERYAKFLTQKLTNVMRGKIVDLSAKRVQEK